MQQKSDNKVPRVKSRSRLEINKIAMGFIYEIDKEALSKPKKIDLQEILDFGYIRRNYGFALSIEDLPTGIEGYTDFLNKKLALSTRTYEGILNKDPRAIFTGFHEVSHVLLHRGQLKNRTIEEANKDRFYRSDLKPFEDPEWQADECSAAIQIPLNTVLPLIKSGATAEDLMKIFGVSRTCAEVRVANILKLVKFNPKLDESRGLFF
ncbi:ImmA/IrrE family metallo-endopeptidase [Leptospira bouyouniensis]|uniref:ImmA/IrrE family metallo-endopeptidase n=1 Tax=Leptospira bouyouniensis TaxID=2484911 RepID=UPI0014385124|nr:ImmA/IrrE family metallo-endopeptidase [Leptospira bouyouniensis]